MNRQNCGSDKRLRFEELEARAFLSGTGAPDASALSGQGFVDGAAAASAFVGAQFPAAPGNVQLLPTTGQLNGTAAVAGDALLTMQIALTADTGALASASSLLGAAAQAQIQAQLQVAQQRSIGYDAASGVGQMLITTGSNTWGAQIWRADGNETGR